MASDEDSEVRSGLEQSPRSIDTLVGETVDGRYEIRGLISRRAFGALFEAWQPALQRTVALKVLQRGSAASETTIRSFHREALAASRITHPNSISVYDFGESDDGILFIAMEYLQGAPLSVVLHEGPMPIGRALAIMRQICEALSEVHRAGIIHRDLKPDHVFLTEVDGEGDFVKVLDFGVAALMGADGEEQPLAPVGAIFGTPKYLSPEQVRAGHLDARSDIYSLGVILYEMLMGEAPFVSDNPLSILIAHVNEQPTPFADRRPDIDVHPAVEALVFRALSKHPDDRQPTANALLEELDAVARLLADGIDGRREAEPVTPAPALQTSGEKAPDAQRSARRWRLPALALPVPVDTTDPIDALTRWPAIAVGLVGAGASMAALSLGGPYPRFAGGVVILGAAVYAGWRGRWVAPPTGLPEPIVEHEEDLELGDHLPPDLDFGERLPLDDLTLRVRLEPGVEPHRDGLVTHHMGLMLDTGRPVLVCQVDPRIQVDSPDGWDWHERALTISTSIEARAQVSPSLLPAVAFGTWEPPTRLTWLLPLRGDRWLVQVLAEAALPVIEAVDIARALADAIGWGHRTAGLLHLGVRPSTVRVSATGEAFVGYDFMRSMRTEEASLARLPEAGPSGPTAPEQVTDGGIVDERTDVYLLGGLLRACLLGDIMPVDPLAGWQPFTRTRPDMDVHPAAEAVVREMMATAPAARPRSMARVTERLDALQALGRGVPYAEVARQLPPMLDMRFIEDGEFTMGSDDYPDEQPPHRVAISAFHISSTTVTQAIYQAVMGQNPSEFRGPTRPVESVTWFEAVAFCNRLSRIEGRTPAFEIDREDVRWLPEADGYRLPTEAEWEYACRAGTTTRWSTGDDEAALVEAAWFGEEFLTGGTHPVAQKAANRWGLYDMHGNVWEWTVDVYADDTYRRRADKVVIDPTNADKPAVRGDRVLRGGSFDYPAAVLRSSFRLGNRPSVRAGFIGFRCVWGARQRPLALAP